MENPWSSKAKQLPEIRRACVNLDEGACDMCVFGLQCLESGEALRKKSWVATYSLRLSDVFVVLVLGPPAPTSSRICEGARRQS